MGVLDKFLLDGKVAIVTGASRGLGAAMSIALAEAGADVAIVARGKPQLLDVADKISRVGRECHPIVLDITEPDSAQRVANEVRNWKGTIDILCNNAGVNLRGSADSLGREEWDTTMRVNLDSAFFFAQAVGRVMIQKRKGKVVNTGSISSILGSPNIAAYAASKGGIMQLTKALSTEWARYNVQVNCLIPGCFNTELTRPLRENRDRYEWFRSRIPAGRWGEPEDLQGAVVFLASAASDYITGATLFVDGGYLSN